MPPGLALRSVAVRREEVTAGVFLCSLVRDGLRCSVKCDGVMMDAGSIRRNHVYPPDGKQFTYGDLKKASQTHRVRASCAWQPKARHCLTLAQRHPT